MGERRSHGAGCRSGAALSSRLRGAAHPHRVHFVVAAMRFVAGRL
jgi:hypothetical protein